MAKPTGTTQTGRLDDFTLVSGFTSGYRAREDITILPPGIMVQGSHDILTNTAERISIRKGYTLDGQADTILAPILTWFDCQLHTGNERHLRNGFLTTANTGKKQYRYVAEAGDIWNGHTFTAGQIYWIDLLTGLPSVNFNSTTFWDTDELKTLIIEVNGTNNIYIWSGAVSTLTSANNNSGVIASITPNAVAGGINYTIGDIVLINGGIGGMATVTQTVNGGLASLTIANPGGSYLAGEVVTLVTAFGTGGEITIDTVDGGGGVLTFHVSNEGSSYRKTALVPVNGGTGDGALTFNIVTVNDGIVSALNLTNPGSGYSAATESTTGGTGTGLQVDIGQVVQGAITLNGGNAEAQNFLATDNYPKQATINNHVYNYTNITGNVLTGITPNPSAEPVQSVVQQTPFIWNIKNINGLVLDTIDLIATLANQVYYGSLMNNNVYLSNQNDFKDVTFSAPTRFPGEGAILNLLSAPTAFIVQETTMNIFAGLNFLYEVVFNQSTTSTTSEGVTIATNTESVAPIIQKTTSKQGAQSQKWVNKIKNNIIYLSKEPIVNTYGRIDNVVLTQQITDISYPIVNDMNNYDFTDGSIMYDRMFAYASIPKESVLRIYNMTNPKNTYWEAPQTIPITGISIIEGELYGHSYQTSQTFKLFTGYNDNNAPIDAVAKFSFNNYGSRSRYKNYNTFFSEGYMSPSTTINLNIQHDIDGCATSVNFSLKGTSKFVCTVRNDAPLGKTNLGWKGLGTSSTTSSPNQLPPKFRWYRTFAPDYFYEDQITYSSLGIDQQWELLSFGPQLLDAQELNTYLTE